jgi:SAM-dependent methyltransferase
MRWLAKAAVQKTLSALPAAGTVNYVLQRHVTRSLPAPEVALRRQFRRALRHVEAFEQHGPKRPLGEAVFYEFGAGWDLALPLCLWCLGVERQLLVDIRRNLRPELVDVTIARLRRLRAELEGNAGRPVREPGPAGASSAEELAERFGVAYLAPRDARATGLEAESVDFVSSTNTLEHVPEEDLGALLRECRRLLRRDGAISCRIDLRDHFADFDPAITPYNFLRYSRARWRHLNSPLMHQNRLRARDYVEAFAAAGFEVLVAETPKPRPEDLRALRRLPVAPELTARYTPDELAPRSLRLVARVRPEASPHAA